MLRKTGRTIPEEKKRSQIPNDHIDKAVLDPYTETALGHLTDEGSHKAVFYYAYESVDSIETEESKLGKRAFRTEGV